MTQYVGALPSGQIAYFNTAEEMAAAGATSPNPIQLAQYAGSKGCNMAQGCATAYQATPPITQATLQQNGSTYNLVQGGQIQPAQVKVATDPTAQIFNIGGRQVAIGGSVLAGGVSGIQQALSGLGFATFSAGAGSTAPKIQENVPAGFARDALESINNVGRSVQQGATAALPAFLMPGLSPLGIAAGAASFLQQAFQPGSAVSGQKSTGAQPQTGAALTGYNPINQVDKTVKALYVPEGSFAQQELTNVKVGVSKTTGELGIYESLGLNPQTGSQRMAVNPETGKLESFILIGGGGRAAVQSGAFTFAAATPAVYGRGQVQQGAEGLVTPKVMAPAVAESGLTGEEVLRIVAGGNAGKYDTRDYLSRVGAEAYGGVVQAIDKRTLGNITYENVTSRPEWSLARYFSPQAANLGKAEAPGANIPWSVGTGTPAAFELTSTMKGAEGAKAISFPTDIPVYLPQYGVVSDITGIPAREPAPTVTIGTPSGPSIRNIDRLIGSKTVAGVTEVSGAAGGLPAPFISSSTGTQNPTGEFYDLPSGIRIPIPDFLRPAVAFFQPGKEVTTNVSRTQIPEVTTRTGRTVTNTAAGALITDYYTTTGGTATQTATSERALPSEFDRWFTGASSVVSDVTGYGKMAPFTEGQIKSTAPYLGIVPGATPFGLALMTPGVSDYATAYLKGESNVYQNKPLVGAGMFGLGLLTGGAFKAAEAGVALGRATAAERIISGGGAYRAADMFAGAVTNYGPTILGAAYAIDVAARSTNLGTDLSPASAQRAGEVFGSEVRPMAFGAMVGYGAPGAAAEKVQAVRGDISQARLEIAEARTQLRQQPTSAKDVSLRDAVNYLYGPRISAAKAKAGEIISGMAGDITVPITIELSGKPSVSPFEQLSNTVLKGAVTARVFARPTIEAGLGRASIEVARYRYAENQPIAESIYGKYFDVKTKAPAKAEAALVSAESGLWTAYQVAKTPGVNIRSAIQESGFKIDTTNLIRPSAEITQFNNLQASFTKSIQTKPIAAKKGDLPSLNKYYQSLYRPQAPKKERATQPTTETPTSSGATLVSKIEAKELPRGQIPASAVPIQMGMFGLPQYPSGPSPIQKGRTIIEEETEYFRLPPGMSEPIQRPKALTTQNVFEVAVGTLGLAAIQLQRPESKNVQIPAVSNVLVPEVRQVNTPKSDFGFIPAQSTRQNARLDQLPRLDQRQTTRSITDQRTDLRQRPQERLTEITWPGITTTTVPRITIPPLFGGGGGFGGGGRKYYGKFREVLMGINYGGFNIRTGTGAKRQSIKGKKSQQISFKNVSNVITGKRRKRK